MEYCASDDWRTIVYETILPVALRGVELGDEAIEIGPGPGFTTDILRTMTAHLTAVELDEGLAAGLAERMAGGNVDVVVGDATALDFAADRFTGAASFHMLHHIAPADSARPRLRRAGPGPDPREASWSPPTGSTPTAARSSTRATPTTRSTRWSWRTGSRGRLRLGARADVRPRVGLHRTGVRPSRRDPAMPVS